MEYLSSNSQQFNRRINFNLYKNKIKQKKTKIKIITSQLRLQRHRSSIKYNLVELLLFDVTLAA